MWAAGLFSLDWETMRWANTGSSDLARAHPVATSVCSLLSPQLGFKINPQPDSLYRPDHHYTKDSIVHLQFSWWPNFNYYSLKNYLQNLKFLRWRILCLACFIVVTLQYPDTEQEDGGVFHTTFAVLAALPGATGLSNLGILSSNKSIIWGMDICVQLIEPGQCGYKVTDILGITAVDIL